MARTLITLPAEVHHGDVIEIRCLIQHPMETGFRSGDDGQRLPRNLIRRFRCFYRGEQVFGAELYAAVAANPLISFWLRVGDGGELRFSWEGDQGFSQSETRTLTVS